MTAAERATLAYIDSMVRLARDSIRSGAIVDPAISPDASARLDDWTRVREDVAYLFTMREDWSPK